MQGEVSLATVIDRAGLQILEHWAQGSQVRAIRVHPDVYSAITTARPREVARGFPLLLLDLELITDSSVPRDEPVVLVD